MNQQPQTLTAYPWSWNPTQRLRQNIHFIDSVQSDERYDDSGRRSLLQFCAASMHKYIIPQHAVDMLDATVLGLPKGEIGELRSGLETVSNEAEHDAMIKRFEQQFLKLPPSSSLNGLRWWESSAGFASGIYPIDAVANSVSIATESLAEMLQDDERDFRTVMIRSGMFLYSVAASRRPETVRVGDVYELTTLGSAVLEAVLGAYAQGMTTRSR